MGLRTGAGAREHAAGVLRPRAVRVLLGVTGGIAAVKAPQLVRRLREAGAEVRCVLTRAAESFVTPLSLEVLSGAEVYRDAYLAPGNGGVELHIEAAQWAEAICVAPATAHLLARLALGLADDFLTTTVLASRAPLILAPAMHTAMWEQESVREHVARLTGRGVRLVGPVAGALASGEIGLGRMSEPEEIAAAVAEIWAGQHDLRGRTVLVTAGPTHEPIDPVRFLGNRSSGKMGFALADEAARRGARVILVAGPVALPTPPSVERLDVETALQMQERVRIWAPRADLIIMAAAVADFRPTRAGATKIKRERGVPVIDLVANPDILAELPAIAPQAVRVGFAAETDELARNATAKLERKQSDFLVANDVSRADIGFGAESNEVTVYRRGAGSVEFGKRPKGELARDLMNLFAEAVATREHRSVSA